MRPSRPVLTARVAVMFIACAALAVASTAHAQIWNEVGDAGDQIATAQITSGSGNITQINGSLPLSDDVDVYCIQLNASPPAGLPIVSLQCVVNQGPDVYLFGPTGLGVVTNYSCLGGLKQLLAPTGSLPPGNYYVAVAYYGRDPNSALGPIWLPALPNQRTPDGPGAAAPLSAWLGIVQQNPLNPYTITLNPNYFVYCDQPVPIRRTTWGSVKLHYGS